MKDNQDAFGHMMYDHLHGLPAWEIIERDDGFFSTSAGPRLYFAPYGQWMQVEKDAVQLACGRVLDIGCGAGRHALYLQEQGLEVTGIDSSPLAVQTCRERGVRDVRLLSLTQVSRQLGSFDTILMMGNNFGLVANPQRARWLLKRFAGATRPGGQLLAFTRDPYTTDLPEHLAYHEHNRRQGRPSGQARIRVRYKKYVSPWWSLLMVSADEMRQIVAPTPWTITGVLSGEGGIYCAILHKKGD